MRYNCLLLSLILLSCNNSNLDGEIIENDYPHYTKLNFRDGYPNGMRYYLYDDDTVEIGHYLDKQFVYKSLGVFFPNKEIAIYEGKEGVGINEEYQYITLILITDSVKSNSIKHKEIEKEIIREFNSKIEIKDGYRIFSVAYKDKFYEPDEQKYFNYKIRDKKIILNDE